MVVKETAAALLAEWRAAERRRDALMPGTLEHERAAAECDLLAQRYQERVADHAEDRRDLVPLAATDQD
jgi:hypothetical protein